MDATDLRRWTRFAAKGGIGTCTALQDCVAESSEDLMFMKDDNITVLVQLADKKDMYLGYCEGVVGRFHGSLVRFHGRLKKPVMTRRSSSNTLLSKSRPSSSQSALTVTARDFMSPPLPSEGSPAPTRASTPRMSYSLSTSSSFMTESSSTNTLTTSPVSETASPLPSAQPLQDDGSHMRSDSPSTMSTALDSAPPAAASFSRGEKDDAVRIMRSPSAAQSSTHGGKDSISSTHTFGAPPSSVAPLNIRKQRSLDQQNEPRAAGIPDTPESSQLSFSDVENDPRISAVSSDGITGVGISLLQGLIGSREEDNVSVHSQHSRASTPQVDKPDRTSSSTSFHQMAGESFSSSRSDDGSDADSSTSEGAHRSLADPDFQPPVPLYARAARDSDVLPRNSMHGSVAGSELSTSDWSDIYDNYRYSRFSMASKMSRLSQGSLRLAVPDHQVPPIPPDLQSSANASEVRAAAPGNQQAALESVKRDVSNQETVSKVDASRTEVRASPEKMEGDPGPASMVEGERSKGTVKGKPSPLELMGGRAPSPLLHSSFASPEGPLSPRSMRSFVSPPPGSPPATNVQQPATNMLVVRPQEEQDLRPYSPAVQASNASVVEVDERQRVSAYAVIEDEGNAYNSIVSPHDAHLTSPTSPTSRAPFPPSPIPPSSPLLPYSSPVPPASPSTPTSPPPLYQIPLALQPHARPQPANRPLNEASTFTRRSLFMPHPHAPKPSGTPAGPMYGRQPMPSSGPSHHRGGPPAGSATQTLHMALASGRGRHITIYARFDHDLANSSGPVPIFFCLEPPNNIPANRPMPVKSQSASAASPAPSPAPDGQVLLNRSLTESPRPTDPNGEPGRPESTTRVIPRQNFFPQAPGVRPRSRSFSGFDSTTVDMLSLKVKSSVGDLSSGDVSPAGVVTMRSKSATSTPAAARSPMPLPSPQRATVSHSTSVVRTVQKPSPLSLSQNNVVVASASPMSVTSASSSPRPGPRQLPPAASSAPGSPEPRMNLFDRAFTSSPLQREARSGGGSLVCHPSKVTLKSEPSTSSPPASPRSPSNGSFQVIRRSQSSILPSAKASGGDELSRPSMSSLGGHSVKDDTRHSHDTQWNVPSPSTGSDSPETVSHPRAGSSRSTTSPSLLRVPTGDRSTPNHSPVAGAFSFESFDKRTVSVKDMDFELVRPAIPHSPLAASSVDSLPLTIPSPRDETATMSFPDASAITIRQPSLDHNTHEPKSPKVSNSPEVQAHRQRELRWMSIMTSVPASQSRKSKKVRKLVLEGVPTSVRYVVWAHLTDSKAKRVDGIYARLGQCSRVASIENIQNDAKALFAEEPLQEQSLVNLLQAYLTMVPDIDYNRGLALIASKLLVQSPEEDAFWTFVSMMDSHLRPYFSQQPIQLEVDASLFARALESNDAILSKKIYIDMAISPAAVCRPWLTSVFAGALPQEFVYRIWDVFLFDGVPFLFRVGLAIMSCCRRMLLQCQSQQSLLTILTRPPISSLPPAADSFIELAFSMKIRDDDLFKQRKQMEAQLKRQTQNRGLSSVSSRGLTPIISLPRS
ncbi:uncharacterized protein LAESUDRAFT_816259 [Laetiporus sulphureus 93-53]|uniref:Rab-GAP TBC domain-containing protein n=1 Tax=Laetiporus sulphureus 93-53 TaxID=1314785 RepID=A0A165BEY1_9APHY|nr:uncharacterized protein LAESUDRAFT_816259 [Laetiporus sulphureus 93-53]KZT00910.1 hypothetical protein LAESUDRAFT_816259 [Laetiporus sulphureus 93-53]